jgi:hypothetical protein
MPVLAVLGKRETGRSRPKQRAQDLTNGSLFVATNVRSRRKLT